MPSMLEVWVAQPKNVSRVLGTGEWRLHIADSAGDPFAFNGMNFGDTAAPLGHWSGSIPPGVYLVWATSKGPKLSTHKAIVDVHCDGLTCAHLFIAPTGRPLPDGGRGRREEEEEKRPDPEPVPR